MVFSRTLESVLHFIRASARKWHKRTRQRDKKKIGVYIKFLQLEPLEHGAAYDNGSFLSFCCSALPATGNSRVECWEFTFLLSARWRLSLASNLDSALLCFYYVIESSGAAKLESMNSSEQQNSPRRGSYTTRAQRAQDLFKISML